MATGAMMDLQHERQHVGAPAGRCNRLGESGTAAAERVVVRQNSIPPEVLEFLGRCSESMLTLILCLFRLVRLLSSGHQAVAAENRRPLSVGVRQP